MKVSDEKMWGDNIMKQVKRMISAFLVCATLLGSAAAYPNETGYVASEEAAVSVQAGNNLESSVKDGLIAHLKLDGTVTDETGNGTPQLVGEATYESGISGQAIRFGGERGKTNGNRIEAKDRSDLKFGAQDTYSAGFWFKAKSNVPDSNMMGTKSWNKASNPGWCLAVNNADNGRFRFAPVGGTGPEYVYRAASSDKLFDGSQWVYLVVTRNGSGEGKMYLNGKQVSAPSQNVTSAADSGVQEGNFCIGADFLGQYGPGNLVAFDDVRIWNRALSDEEIAYLYATTPSLSKVTIEGENRVDVSNGAKQEVTLSVKGTQANGKTIPQDTVTWSSNTEGVTAEPQGNGATAVITVSPDVSPQTVQITATCRGVTGTAQLEVVKDTTAEKVTITGKRAVLKKTSEIRETYSAEFRNRYGTVLTDVQDLVWNRKAEKSAAPNRRGIIHVRNRCTCL